MNIGDLLVKLASGTPLNPEEKQELRLFGSNTQLNNSFVAGLQNGGSSISVETLYSRSGVFDKQPTRAVVLQGARTVLQNTQTSVQFNYSDRYSNNCAFNLDDTDNTKLNVLPGGQGKVFFISGNVAWDGSYTSNVRWEQYDSSDALAYYYPIIQSLTAKQFSFSGYVGIENGISAVRLSVYQSSAASTWSTVQTTLFEVV